MTHFVYICSRLYNDDVVKKYSYLLLQLIAGSSGQGKKMKSARNLLLLSQI